MTIPLRFPCRSRARKHPQRPRFQRLPPPNHSANIPLQWHQSLSSIEESATNQEPSNSQTWTIMKRHLRRFTPLTTSPFWSYYFSLGGGSHLEVGWWSTAPIPCQRNSLSPGPRDVHRSRQKLANNFLARWAGCLTGWIWSLFCYTGWHLMTQPHLLTNVSNW